MAESKKIVVKGLRKCYGELEVLKKIAVAYPKYSDECDRQIFWVELNNRYVG